MHDLIWSFKFSYYIIPYTHTLYRPTTTPLSLSSSTLLRSWVLSLPLFLIFFWKLNLPSLLAPLFQLQFHLWLSSPYNLHFHLVSSNPLPPSFLLFSSLPFLYLSKVHCTSILLFLSFLSRLFSFRLFSSV
ncbi:hypothetical protein BO78DRAFT_19202 [Aspergillus sclerotiicarbonarius CBS 121057]|uniref:Uncharacterized protein n=1 Tax=Aspergillus sclerotiicarbonarius (strain CBS 121057 / IBT 28362) TaxID=1448318 RepID=A0A319DUA2_ASPSB|nr:hypothetical protein BO78DRAFT_19202 [Aspergillus sclerotiicarbonarius CBS 121057]